MSIEDVSIKLSADTQTFEEFMSPELTKIHEQCQACVNILTINKL